MTTGTLRLIKATANPHGADDSQLFLFVGNPTIEPVRVIIPDEGVTLPQRRPDWADCVCRLKVFHINDLHGHIVRFSPQGDQPILSRMVSRLREVRQKHQDDPDTAVLFVSAGDDLVGAVFDELMGDDPDSFALHAGYRLYSAAGIDVSTLGNHDFDLGTSVLAQAIRKDAQFPVLSANLAGCRWLSTLYYPAALMVVKGIRIGIIGLTTPGQTREIADTNLQIVNPIRVVHNMLPAIRPLCDVLIILSHLGYTLSSHAAAVQDAGDVELARSLPPGSVHLIVGGHTHHTLNEQGLTAENIVNGVPIVQAGALGRILGEVDISIQQGAAAVTSVRLDHTSNLPVDETFEAEAVQPLLEVARPLFQRSLGRVADHPDLSTDAVRNSFATGESALANFITDALVARCRANGYETDLAVVDTSVVRRGLPVGGELTFGEWFNLMPFADVLRIAWISGKQLQMLIRDNAYRIDLPGEPHTERGFLHFSGQVRYTIELGNGRSDIRAINITVNGIPLEKQLDRAFQIVCTSFVRGPAAAWEEYGRSTLGLPLMNIREISHMDTPLFLRHELVAYITEQGGVTKEGGAKRNGRLQIKANN
ncbi:MAG: bifunctional metallophosphatase/5'-nucleotidase [Ardenticatenaceae bacterium]|nr:bifunctional metallophosphatase/5'-nucleotidase [Anaerolineales bacterium]MCB8921607.1 bifunctional metallophosphatase/5'-nucleotidase [Ardenticatenaceae bacterium]